MLNFILQTLYPRIPVEFRSRYSISESVERLSSVVNKNMFARPLRETSLGSVSENAVDIRRLPGASGFGTPYVAVFYGQFQTDAEGVVLRGEYAPSLEARVFLTIWFLGVLFVTGFGFVELIRTLAAGFGQVLANPFILAFPFLATGFIAASALFLRLDWRNTQGDIGFIAGLIESTLNERVGDPLL